MEKVINCGTSRECIPCKASYLSPELRRRSLAVLQQVIGIEPHNRDAFRGTDEEALSFACRSLEVRDSMFPRTSEEVHEQLKVIEFAIPMTRSGECVTLVSIKRGAIS